MERPVTVESISLFVNVWMVGKASGVQKVIVMFLFCIGDIVQGCHFVFPIFYSVIGQS